MSSLNQKSTVPEYQEFVKVVYGLNNDRYFTTPDILTQVQRFCMRGLKGIRKGEKKKTTLNFLIGLCWFMSLMNQFHINLGEATSKRFPNVCSYCGNRPCSCKKEKLQVRKNIIAENTKASRTIAEFQAMFAEIYPPGSRTLEHAGIHLAEEMGELAEAVLAYRGERNEEDFEKISEESADFLSCLFGVCNSWDIDLAKELAVMFSENCHACKKAPCECSFQFITGFES